MIYGITPAARQPAFDAAIQLGLAPEHTKSGGLKVNEDALRNALSGTGDKYAEKFARILTGLSPLAWTVGVRKAGYVFFCAASKPKPPILIATTL